VREDDMHAGEFAGLTVNGSSLPVTGGGALPSIAANRLLGRGSASGAGTPEELLVGQGLALIATTLG
jgi:hypothetical protein